MPARHTEKYSLIELLIVCAHSDLSPAERGRLANLLSQPLDFALLLDLADDHGLLPLLAHHLLVMDSAVPPEILAQLRARSRENALHALVLTSELLRILDAFQKKGISAIPYKGPVLAARAYGNSSLRQFVDLDIVAPQKFMPSIYDDMASLGYTPRLPRPRSFAAASRDVPGEYVFFHAEEHVMVELHTEATLRHFPVPPDVERMVRRATIVPVDGRKIPAFAVEDALLMLVVHGAKDFWGRLIWVADIAEIVSQSPSVDWEVLLSEAQHLKLTRMLHLGLSLAHEIFGLTLPPPILSRTQNDPAVKSLSSRLCATFWNRVPFADGLLPRSLFRLRMTENLWDGLRYWLRLSTAPAEEDWGMVRLPRKFSASYFFLRPLRLLQKYGPVPRGS